MSQLLEKLLKYVKENRRVCPQPDKWNLLWKGLPEKSRKGAGWNPPLPLILAAWWESTDKEKRDRLTLHIQYAFEKGVINDVDRYLRSLADDEWIYEGDV